MTRISEIKLEPKTQWGKWKLTENRRWLEFGPLATYEIPLANAETAQEICDWLFQVSLKSWCTSEDLGDLVKALRDTVGAER